MRWLVVVGILASCGHQLSDLDACLASEHVLDVSAYPHCERAWITTFDERAASVGARLALHARNDAAVFGWTARARNDVEGARVFHFAGAILVRRGDVKGAEYWFRRSLALSTDRAPLRAANTAATLYDLLRNRIAADESASVLRIAWQQASLAKDPFGKAIAASGLIELLLDLGELHTGELMIRAIDGNIAPAYKDLSDGRVQAAHGRFALAAALLERAARITGVDKPWPNNGTLDAIEAYVNSNQNAAARALLDRGPFNAPSGTAMTVETACAVSSARAHIELSEGHGLQALASVTQGLSTPCPERARAILLEQKGDCLAQIGRPDDAEQAWRDAADLIEIWRVSIPSAQLGVGLMSRHRHSLERWLDSAAARNDLGSALEAASRLLSRELRDRLLDREPTSGSNLDALIADFLDRIGDGKQIRRLGLARELSTFEGEASFLVEGDRSVWILRHDTHGWSVRSLGDRESITRLANEYRRTPDDRGAAAALGTALFESVPIPTNGDAFVIVVDPELSDLLLPGLRVAGRYLVERAPIVEVLAPELLFTPLSTTHWDPPIVIGDPLGDLPGASREAIDVALALGVAPITRGAATRVQLLEAGHPSILHLATHSSVVDGRVRLSLADGNVSMHELLASGVAPRLAVLATCRSDGGDNPLSSIVAAFLAVGSSGVIGAKRALDDQLASRLFAEFYAAGGAIDPIQALAAAQRNAIRVGSPPHGWASVSFFGSGRWTNARKASR